MSVDTTDTPTDATTEPVVTVTDEAQALIAEIRAGEDDPEALVLRIAISGINGMEFAYDLSFEDRGDGAVDDLHSQVGDLTVVIPADSVDNLRGATLDLPSNPMQGGLVIRNPNRPGASGGTDLLAGKDLDLTGTAAEKVAQLLEAEVNPALANHGGFATLVGVEDETVYVTMGGGCQGCSLSAATLQQGITAAILESIPEIKQVVDVTDHQAGDNPFYT
jgi:Fe/S biogenesis protein NfuA